LKETAQLCPNQSICIVADVSQESDVEKLFAATVEAFGRVDLLFNNAGIGAPQIPIEDMPLKFFTNVMNVNVIGTWLCTRAAFKAFKSQNPQGGRIINNGSVSATTPRPHTHPYTASKHAMMGLTKSTSLDGRAFNISCTQFDIGNALTELGAPLAAGTLQPNGSIMGEATYDPQHAADMVLHIASLPNSVQVLSINVMALQMPFVGRG